MKPGITYRSRNHMPVGVVRALFRHSRRYDGFSAKDTQWYLRHALFVASAWHGRRAVGLAVLGGDGRIGIELDTLIVDEPYRGGGIGKALLEQVVAKAEALKPQFFKVEVYQKRTEKRYARFGFRRNEGTWLLEHIPLGERLRQRVRRTREKSR